MGAYLSEPKTSKDSSDNEGDRVKCGASSMQGWRISQEDAHNCILHFDKNSSLFAVYDGHGGHEVAEYCSKNLPEFIKQVENYKNGNYEQALKDAFLEFDATLATPEVIEVLKKIASGKDETKSGSDEEDGSDSEEEEMNNLVQEASMPLDEVMAKYRSAGPLGRLKGEGKPPVSPMLRARRTTAAGAGSSSSGAGSSKGDGEVSSSSSSSHQETSSLCNGDTHVNGDVAEEEGESKSEAEVKVDSSEKTEKPVKSESNKSSGVEVIESEKNSRTEPDSSGISNGETHDISSEKCAGDSANEAISSTSPPKKKKVSSAEIYKSLLQDDSDSEEEDETFTADAESEDNSSDEVNNDAEEDDEDSSLEDEEDEDDEEMECHGLDDVKEEPGLDSGCTAVLALLVGSELYVANAGDSRCVVSREGKALEMSTDHKPEDEPERERIENAGGKVTSDGRVNGGLNLSRALGDHSYKQVAPLPPQKQMITALPEVRKLTVDPEKDEFMVLACDGIWNSMTSQEVVDFVRIKLEQGTTRLSQICEELFDHCLAADTVGDGTGCDNMTCVIVQFKALEAASAKRTAEDHEEEPNTKRSKVEEEVTQTS